MKKCPMCAEEIQDEAVKCRFCGDMLTARQKTKWYFNPTTMVIAFLSLGPLALPLVWWHPRMSVAMKIVLTAIVCVATYVLGVMVSRSLKAILSYYTMTASW